MSKEPTYITEFRKLTRGLMSLADLPKLEAELFGASARASAVMLGSMVEGTLEHFLQSKLRPSINSDDKRFCSILGDRWETLPAKY